MSLLKPIEVPESRLPAVNDIPEDAPVGERPYEMAGREEDREPLCKFDDLSGWTVSTWFGAKASLSRSKEQPLWREHNAKLTYVGESTQSRVLIEPPQPIEIPDEFDCISIWAHADKVQWDPNPQIPLVGLAVVLLDARGERHKTYLNELRWLEWWLVHRKLTPRQIRDIAFPCRFAGIELQNVINTEERTLYLDSLCFYTEELAPLSFRPRPGRNLTLPEGQSPGLNTGPGKLPFPTREETILPSNFEPEFENSVEQVGDNKFLFHYRAKDAEVTYSYDVPEAGEFGSITASVNGKAVCRPLDGGGVRFAQGTSEAFRKPWHVETRLEGDSVVSIFKAGTYTDFSTIEYRMMIMQKSLVIDVACRGGAAEALDFGRVADVTNPRLITVPYISFLLELPRVLMSGSTDEPQFTSIWADWYRSNGSELWADVKLEERAACVNSGVRYIPKTDGIRNDLFERIFITVSPTFEEVLPTIANPVSTWGDVAGERLWQRTGPSEYEKEMERSRMLRSYGIEKLIQCNHEATWRDGWESFTLRTEAAPKRGGDEALARYVAHQKALGWLSGLYTNYTDFAPVNKHWSEDAVQRTPDEQYRRAWPRNYGLKPSKAVEFEEDLAPIIKRKFGQNSSYTDVHTALPPWFYCDFDARVPGAGTFSATFYAYGELLLNDRKNYDGPIFSEGTFQWLYAGLTDGNYALCYLAEDYSKVPLNVAFVLHKIHPLECDIGMGWTAHFLKDQEDWNAPEKIDAGIDHFLAATIAYGHIGWLVEEAHGIERACRSYYMMQQLQKRYAMQRPKIIEYADDSGEFVSVSKALAKDVIKDSRLHVVYENGLELFVNGSEADWKVEMGGESYVLPPWGWCARHEATDFIEFSALTGDGRRIDYVRSPEYEYLDGRGVYTEQGSLGVTGAAALRRLDDGRSEIIDIYGNEEISLSGAKSVEVSAYGEDGSPLSPPEMIEKEKDFRLKCVPGARRYVIATQYR